MVCAYEKPDNWHNPPKQVIGDHRWPKSLCDILILTWANTPTKKCGGIKWLKYYPTVLIWFSWLLATAVDKNIWDKLYLETDLSTNVHDTLTSNQNKAVGKYLSN
jgi:hypothetical protein